MTAGKIIPALNGFVPKPNTPFQWEPICEERELKRRLKWLSKNLSRIPNVEVRVMSARIAHEQALFSLGDRSVVVKGRVAHCRISDVDQELVHYKSGVEFIELSERVAAAIAGTRINDVPLAPIFAMISVPFVLINLALTPETNLDRP